jgi:hypothetical protein
MLIGIQLSDLSRRSRWLLGAASLAFLACLTLFFVAPEPAVRLMRIALLAVVALGAYWVSFLLDFRGRLNRSQVIVATLFALLPWILVIIIVVGFPQILMPTTHAA